MKITFDAASFFAAITASSGASRQILQSVVAGRTTICMSAALWREYERLCQQPAGLNLAGITRSRMDGVLRALVANSDIVTLDYSWRPVMKDPHDDLVLASAIMGGADMIVSLRPAIMAKTAQHLSLPVYTPSMAITTGILEL